MADKNIDIGHLERSLEYFERLSSTIQGLEPISYDCDIPEAIEYLENMELVFEIASELRRLSTSELEDLEDAGASLEECVRYGAAQDGVVKWYNFTVKDQEESYVLSNNVISSVKAVLSGYISILSHKGE